MGISLEDKVEIFTDIVAELSSILYIKNHIQAGYDRDFRKLNDLVQWLRDGNLTYEEYKDNFQL